MRQIFKYNMVSLKIDEKWARSILSRISLKLGLTHYAESIFPQHIRKSEENIDLMKRGPNFEEVTSILYRGT